MLEASRHSGISASTGSTYPVSKRYIQSVHQPIFFMFFIYTTDWYQLSSNIIELTFERRDSGDSSMWSSSELSISSSMPVIFPARLGCMFEIIGKRRSPRGEINRQLKSGCIKHMPRAKCSLRWIIQCHHFQVLERIPFKTMRYIQHLRIEVAHTKCYVMLTQYTVMKSFCSILPSICFCSCGGAAASMEAVRGSCPWTWTAGWGTHKEF